MNQEERDYIIKKSEEVNKISQYRDRILNNNIHVNIDDIEWFLFQESTNINIEEFFENIKTDLLNKIEDRLHKIYYEMKNDLKKGIKKEK